MDDGGGSGSSLKLKGKIAFVTGAGNGIGRSCCAILAREGARVALADVDDAGTRETLSRMPKEHPEEGRHLCLHVDVADESSVADAVEAVRKHFGRPADVIVNCAGVMGIDAGILDMELEQLRHVHRINFEGTFLVMRAFVRAMRDANLKGSVINFSSVGCKQCRDTRGHYTTSKAAVSVLSKTAAKEWAPFGVRCNAILPGYVLTQMMNERSHRVVKEACPMKRAAKPEEIGEVVAFLASDLSSYVNGSEIPVTGGKY